MERIPVIKGQLLNPDGKPFGPPLLDKDPISVCEILLPTDGDWGCEEEGPLAIFSVVWMTQEDFDNLPEWEGP